MEISSGSTGPERSDDLDVQRLLQLRKAGVEPRLLFDGGASNGRWTRRVSQAFPEATFELFEPLIDHAPEYREGMEQLLAAHPRFGLHKVALGQTCRPAQMHIDKNLVGSTALELGMDGPREWASIEVEMVTIDHFMEQSNRPSPQVIKLDTQGCELAILQGAERTLPRVDLLLVECWLHRGYGATTPLLLEVAEWLRHLEFYLWDFGGCYRNSGGLVSQDCYFLNARSKASPLCNEPSRNSAQPKSGVRRRAGGLLRRFGELLAGK